MGRWAWKRTLRIVRENTTKAHVSAMVFRMSRYDEDDDWTACDALPDATALKVEMIVTIQYRVIYPEGASWEYPRPVGQPTAILGDASTAAKKSKSKDKKRSSDSDASRTV